MEPTKTAVIGTFMITAVTINPENGCLSVHLGGSIYMNVFIDADEARYIGLGDNVRLKMEYSPRANLIKSSIS